MRASLLLAAVVFLVLIACMNGFCKDSGNPSIKGKVSQATERDQDGISSNLNNYIENNFNRYDKRFEQYDKTIDRTYTIVGYSLTSIAIIIALLSWIGFNTLQKWIKQIVREKTTEEYETNSIKLKNEYDRMIMEMEEKARSTFKDIDSTRTQYLETLELLKSSTIGEAPNISATDSENLSKFVKDLDLVKSENEYTSDDWYFKAMSEMDKKNFNDAVKHLIKAISKEPTNLAYSNLAHCFSELGKYEEAIEMAEKAIELDRNDSYSYNLKGWCFTRLANYDDAIASYETSFNINKRTHSTRLSLVEMYLVKGLYEKAAGYLDFNTKKYILIHNLLTVIVNKLMNSDSTKEETTINELLKSGKCKSDWVFSELELLLSKPDIPDKIKEYISVTIAKIKSCGT